MDLKLGIKVAKIGQAHPAVHAAYEAFKAAVKAAQDAKKVLTAELKKTPEWTIIHTSANREPVVRADGYGNSELSARYVDLDYRNDTSIAPQTLNALLTMKLLTDEQKKNLLKQQGILIDGPKPRGEDNALSFANFDDEIPF